MIRDYLIPALRREFAGWEIAFDTPPHAIATFPARQAAVGRVMVYDDRYEATVLIEKVTHGHFNAYHEPSDAEQRDRSITQDVLDFLKALFNDRVLLHTSPNNRSGGWTRLKDGPVEFSPACRYFL